MSDDTHEEPEDWVLYEKDPATKRYPRISITVGLPPEFPEKYRAAIVSAAEQCSVKKHLLDPPEIAISAVRDRWPRSELVAASPLPI